MNLWVIALCVTAAVTSLLLLRHRYQNRTQRLGSAVIQVCLWGLAWILWQPPLLLPPLQNATIHTGAGATQTPALPPTQIAALQSLTITGDGLRRDALRDLPPVRLQTTATADAGWQYHWQRQLTLGDSLQLHISTHSPVAQATRVTLEDPFGTPIASQVIDAGEKVNALLSNVPKLSGRQLYRLNLEIDTHDAPLKYHEPLPVWVHNARQPTVLLWLARPSFETAALSRWLNQSGVPAQVITQLAPEMLRRESFNGFALRDNTLLDPTAPFDLVILDSQLWPQLTSAQRRQLNQLAHKKSLLWLVMPDSPQEFITYTNTQNMPLGSAPITQVASPFAHIEAIPALRHNGYQPQYSTKEELILAADSTPLYWGRNTADLSLGFVLFSDSHRWQTSGFSKQYSQLWKSLFDHQLAQFGSPPPISLSTPLPRARQRVSLCSAGFTDNPPRLLKYENNTAAPGIAGTVSAIGRCYTYWPKEAGWYHIDGQDESGFYVFAEKDWTLWQKSLMHAETQQMASARLGPANTAAHNRQPLPRYWAALALLGLLSLTWWRERGLN